MNRVRKYLKEIFKIRLEKIDLFLLKRRLCKQILNNKTSSKPFLRSVLKYITIYEKEQYVATAYLKELLNPRESGKSVNAIDDSLQKQELALPVFFRDEYHAFNIDECLGIGENKKLSQYKEAIKGLKAQSSHLSCDYFLSLLAEGRSFHYLKYTHGLWDKILRCKVKEYAVEAGRDIVMSQRVVSDYTVFGGNNFAGSILDLVNSSEFIEMVQKEQIYFCPTLGNGSVSSEIEWDILNDFSDKSFLYNYSQLMLLKEFSANKSLCPSNLFKKIICTDALRHELLSSFGQYNLVLICNHRVAASLIKIYPDFDQVYCLPDSEQDRKHIMHPMEFANDICKAILNDKNSKPILILSQMSVLSTFLSYVLLAKYKDRNVSLIDIGKPLQTLFSPETTGGGKWRDQNNLKDNYFRLSYLMSNHVYEDFISDTSIYSEAYSELKGNMDCENASVYRDVFF